MYKFSYDGRNSKRSFDTEGDALEAGYDYVMKYGLDINDIEIVPMYE